MPIINSHLVFDLRISRYLLSDRYLRSSCFSSNGSLFAGISMSAVHIWKYTSDGYVPWREFPLQDSTFGYHFLQFSPTLSSLFVHSKKFLQLWYSDGPPVVARPDRRMPPLVALSRCGSYIATCDRADSTVTITNLISQTPSHFIDTGMMIETLALTGNVLLVLGSGTIVAWRLTEEGIVDGVLADRRASHRDSIWTVLLDCTAIRWPKILHRRSNHGHLTGRRRSCLLH